MSRDLNLVAAFMDILRDENPERIQVGDTLVFEKNEGWKHWLTILGIRLDGTVEAAFWKGMPHFVFKAHGEGSGASDYQH